MTEYIEIIRKIAEDKGGKCISDLCRTTKSKVEIECKFGHRWFVLYGNLVSKGRWCKVCNIERQKRSIKDANLLAKSRNGTCISTVYVKNNKKLTWQCSNNHVFCLSYNKVSQGRWCTTCSGRIMHTIDECHVLAKVKNGECLAEKYTNSNIKIPWRCEKGHIFYNTFSNILKGQWCGICHCQSIKKYSIQDAIKIAQQNNGECLSQEYINYISKMDWECKCGNTWQASFSSVIRGSWCELCKKYKTQKKLLSVIKEIYGSQVFNNFKKFGWLKHNNGRQEIDIWVPHIKLAIEYDGEGHFFPVNFGGCSDQQAMDAFEKTKERDKIKNDKIKSHSDDIQYFIRFDYTEKNKINKEYVVEKFKQNNIPVT